MYFSFVFDASLFPSIRLWAVRLSVSTCSVSLCYSLSFPFFFSLSQFTLFIFLPFSHFTLFFFFFFILLIHPFHFSSILSLHPFHFLLFIPILCRFLYLPLPLPSPLLSHVSIFPSLSLSLFILSSHLCFAFFVPPHQPFLFFFSLLYLSLHLSLYTLSSH